MFVSYSSGLAGLASEQDCSEFFSYDKPIPESFDWRKEGVVTAVKKQGTCGNCYIFSALAAVESGYLINHRNGGNVSFSEQAVLNCIDKTNPCGGGWMSETWNHLQIFGTVNTKYAPYLGYVSTLLFSTPLLYTSVKFAKMLC